MGTNDKKSEAKTKGRHWLCWWKIEPEELQKQVTEYKTLTIMHSARGASLLALLFACAWTIGTIATGYTDRASYFDVGVLLILGLLIYRGKKWAMIAAMIVWSFEKLGTVYLAAEASGKPDAGLFFMSLVWWSVYMQLFYLAFQVERKRETTT